MNDCERFAVPTEHRAEPLRDCVRDALRFYLRSMADHEVTGLYRMVMAEVEEPMIAVVMEHTKGNQSAAAEVLGISRGTLRKKLKESEGGSSG